MFACKQKLIYIINALRSLTIISPSKQLKVPISYLCLTLLMRQTEAKYRDVGLWWNQQRNEESTFL